MKRIVGLGLTLLLVSGFFIGMSATSTLAPSARACDYTSGVLNCQNYDGTQLCTTFGLTCPSTPKTGACAYSMSVLCNSPSIGGTKNNYSYVPIIPTPTPFTYHVPTPSYTYSYPTPSYTYSYPTPSYTYSYPTPSYTYSYPTPTASAVTNNNVQTLNQFPDRGHSAGTATAVYQLFTQSRPAPIGLLVETPSTCSANGDSTYINFLSPGTCNVLVTSFATNSLPVVSKLLSLTVLPSTLPSPSPVLITPQEVQLPKDVTNTAKPKMAIKVSKKKTGRKK